MKTIICSSQPLLYLSSKPSPWNPKNLTLLPTTTLNLKHPTSKFRPHAKPKGFTGAPATGKETTTGKKSNQTNNKDEEEIPQVVFERIIVRILGFVGVPLAFGLALLYILGAVKEQHLWDVPLWIPFSTTFLTFGGSAMGLAYGALSTSWDSEKKGSVLGFEEAQKNWVEVWREEDKAQR